jgi:hypothetical protein
MATAKRFLPVLVMMLFLLSGCGSSKQTFVKPPLEENGPVQPPPPPALPPRSWEDKVWFEKTKEEKQFVFSLQPREFKTMPMQFSAAGNFKATPQLTAPVGIYLNQQENNDRGSTKYAAPFENRITAEMIKSGWYLHLVSESAAPVAAVIKIEFVPETQTLVTLSKPAEKKNGASPRETKPEQPKTKSDGTTTSTKTPTGRTTPSTTPRSDPNDPCVQARAALAQAQAAYDNKEYEKAYNLCKGISAACQEISHETEVLTAAILKDMQNELNRISALVDQKKCREARNLLPRLKGFSELYGQAEQLIATCENPCPALGRLAVSGGRGQGLDARGQLQPGRETCYQVTLATRGDLEVLIDIGYKIEGGDLEVTGLKDVMVNGQMIQKLRYAWQNVKPNTTLQVQVRNNDGPTGFTINFYLYPN